MKQRLGWTLLAWYYVAYGMGGPYPPQLFGPFISEEQCVAQANDWSARGVASVCLKSEIQGLPSYGGAIVYPPAPTHLPAGAPAPTPPAALPCAASLPGNRCTSQPWEFPDTSPPQPSQQCCHPYPSSLKACSSANTTQYARWAKKVPDCFFEVLGREHISFR